MTTVISENYKKLFSTDASEEYIDQTLATLTVYKVQKAAQDKLVDKDGNPVPTAILYNENVFIQLFVPLTEVAELLEDDPIAYAKCKLDEAGKLVIGKPVSGKF